MAVAVAMLRLLLLAVHAPVGKRGGSGEGREWDEEGVVGEKLLHLTQCLRRLEVAGREVGRRVRPVWRC